MTLRQAVTPKSQQKDKAGAKPELNNVLERLIATLNRIENKLDRL